MIECWNCGCELEEEDVETECPYCGEENYSNGFIECENCGTLNTESGDDWECEYCANEGPSQEQRMITYSSYECPECGGEMEDDGYCEECGYGDVNQGWVGENYG